jgi:hypothetical protein
MFVRLANPEGMFHDPHTDLKIVKSEVVEIQRAGSLTQAWLNGGGLKCCDAEVKKTEAQQGGESTPVASTTEDNTEVELETQPEPKTAPVTKKPIGKPKRKS